MARTKGPLASLEASGSIAGVLAYATNKRRSYVKRSTKPKQPRTPAQVGRRAAMGFISSGWSSVVILQRNTWTDLAYQWTLSLYHAYLKFNGLRWTTGQYPTRQPINLIPLPAAVGIALTPVARNRTIQINPNASTPNANWGLSLHRSTSTGFTPDHTNVRAFVFLPPNPAVPWVDGPLPPATYYYRAIPFMIHGFAGTPSPEYSATIT